MNPTAKFLGVCSLAVAAAACHLDLAEAGTLRGNKERCEAFAYSFDNMAIYREMGMTWADAKPQIEAAIEASKVADDGLVKDADDVAFTMSTAYSLWNGAYALLKPGEVGVAVFSECMGAVGKRKVMT